LATKSLPALLKHRTALKFRIRTTTAITENELWQIVIKMLAKPPSLLQENFRYNLRSGHESIEIGTILMPSRLTV
jgi:hypothetical protein